MAKVILGSVLVVVSCCFAVLASGQLTYSRDADALRAIRRKLVDPRKHLRNWKKGDPCVSKWTGVICTTEKDGYQHVTELRMLNLNLSGTLAPEFGNLSSLSILNLNWNQDITGSIPKEIGNIKTLTFLLLSGNKLSGHLPDELGYLPNLIVFQVDYNQISGSLPTSYVNLISCVHFHMTNNSISGQIPPELSTMPRLEHFLLDNNNLSGSLPREFSQMPNLTMLQVDNNNFGGTEIPDSYSSMSKLVKLSVRNCNLRGAIPDFSSIKSLRYLDLSRNQLSGEIPINKLSDNITTIDLSYNLLKGSIPSNFSGLPRLQRLSLQDNHLVGDVPTDVWENVNSSAAVIIDLRNNMLSDISSSLRPPSTVTIRLEGNVVCNSANQLSITQFCGDTNGDHDFAPESSNNSNNSCRPCHIKDYEEYVPDTPEPCFCASPLGVRLRLKSPSISDFRPYKDDYKGLVISSMSLYPYQLVIASFEWKEGPRLLLDLKFFPQYSNDTGRFNNSEILRIVDTIATYGIDSNDDFGSYEVINFVPGPYADVAPEHLNSGISKGILAGILLGAISLVVSISVAIVVIFFKRHSPSGHKVSRRYSRSASKLPIRTESVKEFSYGELKAATNGFDDNSEVGRGGYGKVYRGVLDNGTVVAIKRAQQGSLQGQTEFITEIELLSRLHHRNLVSLVGYCCEKDEQMLVYEFMPNGSLHDHLSHKNKRTLSFQLRMRIALGAAKGILYLHSEAYPTIIHRDIKANNILLDLKFNAKVSDFGISKPAPDHAEGTSSHISTVVKGTPGYLDPEYFLTHKLTDKSDVYSLGIVFLELLTGMQPISRGKNIVREVFGACHSGMMFSIVDKSMVSYPSDCIEKFMALALKCCEDDPKDRPTMLVVVRELESICSKLPRSDSDSIPTEAVSVPIGTESSIPHSGKSSQFSNETLGSELVSGVIPTISPR